MRILDISQPLGTATAVWPGDRAFGVEWGARIEDGASVNLAAVRMSVHTGTHVDGTLHFDGEGRAAGEMPLEAYIGPAIVVDAVGRAVLDSDVLRGVELGAARRVLFRTRSGADPGEFPATVAHMTVALADTLARRGVLLVGTDAPSVDPIDSKALEAHHALARGGVAILENAWLEDAAPGRYFLVALPLRFVEADSSPVRAVLIEGLADPAAG